MGSKSFSLGAADFKALGRNVLIACAGAALTVLSEWSTGVDLGTWTGPVMLAVSGAIDAARRFLSDFSKVTP